MALDKEKALQTALTQIEKQFGKGAVMRLGENKHMNVDHISTGSLTLDSVSVVFHEAESLKFTARNLRVKPRFHSTALQRDRKTTAMLPL